MQRGERDLGGTCQVEVVFLHPVDLLLGVGEHAGPVQRLFAHQDRRHNRLESLADEPRERELHQRELE